MNKNRLVLPLAALLLVPAFTGCDTRSSYQPSFNNDQIICAHGTQVLDLTLDSAVRNRLKFKETLSASDFEMPEEYKDKTIDYAFPYDDASLLLVVSGDVDSNKSEDIKITIKKSAFKNKALDGYINVSFFPNQIQYGSYSQGHGGIGEEDYSTIEEIYLIGAEFDSAILNQNLDIKDKKAADGLITFSNIKANEGSITIFKESQSDDTYLLVLDVKAENINEPIKVTFGSNSTNLGDYECTYIPIGYNETGPFYFEQAN